MKLQKISKEKNIEPDSWLSLKAFTNARIALGRTGVAVPLKESLHFKLSHAHARDAVYSVLQSDKLVEMMQQFQLPVITVASAAVDRTTYLQRPDYGRKLNSVSARRLTEQNTPQVDIVIVIADGLSATAVNEHAVPVLEKSFIKIIWLFHSANGDSNTGKGSTCR